MTEEGNVDNYIKPTEEQITRVEEAFLTLFKRDYIKFGSKKFYEYQMVFFSGAMMAFNYALPSWSVCLMGQRPIIGKYK